LKEVGHARTTLAEDDRGRGLRRGGGGRIGYHGRMWQRIKDGAAHSVGRHDDYDGDDGSA
jgi:hypothetical protein